jgi:hypothetical protein
MYRYLLVLAAALVIPASSFATDISVSGHVSVSDRNTSVDVAFSNHDKSVIATYYQRASAEQPGGWHGNGPKHGGRVPPGLAKHGGLPPGIAKRDRLPPEVVTEPLPPELERHLSPLPSPNYVRVKVGQDLVIMDKRTRVVLDIAFGLGG